MILFTKFETQYHSMYLMVFSHNPSSWEGKIARCHLAASGGKEILLCSIYSFFFLHIDKTQHVGSV